MLVQRARSARERVRQRARAWGQCALVPSPVARGRQSPTVGLKKALSRRRQRATPSIVMEARARGQSAHANCLRSALNLNESFLKKIGGITLANKIQDRSQNLCFLIGLFQVLLRVTAGGQNGFKKISFQVYFARFNRITGSSSRRQLIPP